MSSASVKAIAAYCKDNGKSAAVQAAACGLFEQQLAELIEDQTSKGSAPSPVQEQAMVDTLLSKNSLAALVRLAEDTITPEVTKALGPLRRQQGAREFWLAVASGIVSSLIYSLLLIIVFIVAQDQLRSWLASLQPPAITSSQSQSNNP